MENQNVSIDVLEAGLVVLEKTFNIYGDYENPMFLAKDVAEWIEYARNDNGAYQTSKMLSNLDENERVKLVLDCGGNNITTGPEAEISDFSQPVWFVTEFGLYEILMMSRKPIAKQFKTEIKNLLKGLRTKQIAVVQTPTQPMSQDDMLKTLAENVLVLLEEKKQLIEQRNHAIATKNQISNKIAATSAGRLGGTMKVLNAVTEEKYELVKKVSDLEQQVMNISTEVDRTVLAFCQKFDIKATEQEMQTFGRALTAIHKEKEIPMGSIPAGRFNVHTYNYDIMLHYFIKIGKIK